MKSEETYLRSIIESIEQIEQYISVGYEEFIKNKHWQDAIERRLISIGEAVKHINDANRRRHPEIDWRRIAGTRDVLTHDYFIVDPDSVWLAANDLKLLRTAIQDILSWY